MVPEVGSVRVGVKFGEKCLVAMGLGSGSCISYYSMSQISSRFLPETKIHIFSMWQATGSPNVFLRNGLIKDLFPSPTVVFGQSCSDEAMHFILPKISCFYLNSCRKSYPRLGILHVPARSDRSVLPGGSYLLFTKDKTNLVTFLCHTAGRWQSWNSNSCPPDSGLWFCLGPQGHLVHIKREN